MDSFFPSIGKTLIILGAVLIIVGIIVVYGNKIPYIGRLPGDIYVKKDNVTFYFPLTTCLLISLVLYLLLKIFGK